MINQTKSMKAVELIFDWNLWPRCEAGDLDSTHMKRLKEAMKTGVKMPPVIVNKKDNRLVDGFHRTRAVLDLYGEQAEIDVELRDYKSDAEMFIASAEYNSKHGIPLSPKDRAHVIIKAKKFGIPVEKIASAIGVTVEELKDFFKKRTAETKEGEFVALPYGASQLAGRRLSRKQEEFVRSSNGTPPLVYARILLNGLNANAIILDKQHLEVFELLYNKLGEILAEVGNGRQN